jgi:hypothetical protein
MNIENRLRHAFKQSAEHLIQPHQLDDRIEHLFDVHSQAKGNSFKWFYKQNKFARAVIIAACFFIFSGFAYTSTVLYHFNFNNIHIKVSKNSQLNFSQKQLDEIIGSRDEVKKQLSPGESAYVFIAELDKIKIPGVSDVLGMGLIKVSHPQPYLDMNQWKELTKTKFAEFIIPTALPDGFAFTRGEIAQTNYGTDMYDQEKYYKMLKDKAINDHGKMAWQKADSDDYIHHVTDLNTPRLIYTNRTHDQIEVTYTVKPLGVENMNFTGMMSDSSTAEKVNVVDLEGYYTIDNNNIFSDSGYMQDINWLEQVNGQTIIYHVSTPSKHVTKDDLLLVANHMQ